MSSELLKDLCKFLRKHITTKKIDEEDLYDYLMNLIKPDDPLTSTSKRSESKTLTLKKLLSSITDNQKVRERIEQAIQNNKEDIISIYEKLGQPVSSNKKPADLFVELCYIAIAQENPCKFARSFSNHKLKHGTYKTTIGRKEDAMQLKSLLDEYRKVIVSGELGSGKTRFIKYCLAEWDVIDYCYIDFDNHNDIQTNLHQIQYVDEYGDTYWGSENELKNESFSSSLLIIDNMYNSPDLPGELEWLVLCQEKVQV